MTKLSSNPIKQTHTNKYQNKIRKKKLLMFERSNIKPNPNQTTQTKSKTKNK